jgi:LDH2 family malate/lactate/ureidoglycolate dehydrogenase
LVLDPGMFRDPDEFRADVSRFLGMLRATKPIDPAEPVLVAGDPEKIKLARRTVSGIDVPKGLTRKLRSIADAAGAPWLLN